ncbi:MAG: BtaA family protein [Candidatus Obscuribacterales bacterium]|nr:BtaA family protein [Candidatus Obscuribacterales bacterium]
MSLRNSGTNEFKHSAIRYAQCWEDADVMLAALNIQPGDVCLSIASGGENSLSMLVANPAKVVAIDLNPAQLACLELKMAGFRCLTHAELLVLIGSVSSLEEYHRLFSTEVASISTPQKTFNFQEALKHRQSKNESDRAAQSLRVVLYRRCRKYLSEDSRVFWDANGDAIRRGIGHAGRFENYFAVFRNLVMPLVHSKRTVNQLLAAKTIAQQQEFYRKRWNTPAWQLLFRAFFSKRVMAALGRTEFQFQYVTSPVAERILERTAYALENIPTADNSYLQWILKGKHGKALPHALRRENFDAIKRNINRLELRCGSVEDALNNSRGSYDRFNLSDIFEYQAPEEYRRQLELVINAGRPGARLVYWNMLTQRQCPPELSRFIRSLDQVSGPLFKGDRAFFYSDLRVEELEKCLVTSAL